MGYVTALVLFGGVRRCLPRFVVQVDRSEIMLGVLVVILRPNRVAHLGFGARQREIPFIIFSRFESSSTRTRWRSTPTASNASRMALLVWVGARS
jgi:hypothetical protein